MIIILCGLVILFPGSSSMHAIVMCIGVPLATAIAVCGLAWLINGGLAALRRVRTLRPAVCCVAGGRASHVGYLSIGRPSRLSGRPRPGPLTPLRPLLCSLTCAVEIAFNLAMAAVVGAVLLLYLRKQRTGRAWLAVLWRWP